MDILQQHVLIVDDNFKNLQLTARILNEHGYKISVAPDGNTALSLLQSEVPDIILLDIMMPGMDGLELCRIIKSKDQFRDIPVIFLTARNQMEDLVVGFGAGGVDYITKPFRKEELLIRIQNHLELAASRKTILEMVRTRDKLYSVIAHDIRSSFAGILFTIRTLKNSHDQIGETDLSDMLDCLEKNTQETNNLLNNLLVWTRAQSNQIILSPRVTYLHPLINDCLVLYQTAIDAKKISTYLDIPSQYFTYGDEVTLHAIFRNLISNAIKFTPQNGKIWMNAFVERKFITVKVRDSGVGMDPGVVDKIFRKNQQHTSFGTASEQGTGIGLRLVQDFIKLNGGKIQVSSEPGQGTEIEVILPLQKPE